KEQLYPVKAPWHVKRNRRDVPVGPSIVRGVVITNDHERAEPAEGVEFRQSARLRVIHSIQLSYERVGCNFTAVSAPSPMIGRGDGGARIGGGGAVCRCCHYLPCRKHEFRPPTGVSRSQALGPAFFNASDSFAQDRNQSSRCRRF